MIRIFALVIVCTILPTGSAQACRGTVEFKEVAAAFAKLNLESEGLKDLLARFNAALEAHKEAHRTGNMRDMLKALKRLRDLKAELPK